MQIYNMEEEVMRYISCTHNAHAETQQSLLSTLHESLPFIVTISSNTNSDLIRNRGMQCHRGKVGGHVFVGIPTPLQNVCQNRDSKKHGRRPARDDTASHLQRSQPLTYWRHQDYITRGLCAHGIASILSICLSPFLSPSLHITQPYFMYQHKFT